MQTSTARPERVLVVIGGLPGSGKTTLLRRWSAPRPPGVVAVDSEQVTERLRTAGVTVPYPLLRPWVHGWHRWRVLRALRSAVPVVVLTDPWTSDRRRSAVLAAARRSGRSVRLVLLDAPRELAEQGQLLRGRRVSARAMQRHSDRWTRLVQDELDRPGSPPTWLVGRAGADRLGLDDVLRAAPPCADRAAGTRIRSAGTGVARPG